MKHTIKKRKKFLILCAVILLLIISYYGTLFHIKRNIIIEIDSSDTFNEWEIQSAIRYVIADFTIWHPLSPFQQAAIKRISYCEEKCNAEWNYYAEQLHNKRENFLVIECTFLTDDNANERVIDMENHTTYSQYWIFSRKAAFLPWVLYDRGYD